MRIQHNISALNSYRNYTNNTGMVSKNLEKLSSGYRINRAGDDAAGLAISEKMRAQITGLAAAQKNAQDGVSLVQTAEGAMTEIHSMLNRMTDLATQSSNGTYSNAVDRENIQEEFNALSAEINRIADATNFNGINLLDGSLGGGGAAGPAGVPKLDGMTLTDNAATISKGEFTLTAAGAQTKDTEFKFQLTFKDADGKDQTVELSAKFVYNSDAGGKGKLVVGDKEFEVATGNTVANTDLAKAFVEAAKQNKTISENFKVTDAGGGKIALEAKTAGANTQVIGAAENWTGTTTNDVWKAQPATGVVKGEDAYQSINFATDYNLGDVITIGGKKFAIVKTAADAEKMDKDVNVVIQGTAGTMGAADIKNLASLIQQKTGYKPEIDGTTNTKLNFKAAAGSSVAGSGGLTLQIGDTADDFNQLNVSINDMHASALGVDGLNLLDQDSAKESINVIKDAINTVSAARGKLGAAQNRLEHTINNLSVTEENMTAAESRIRDTDVAKEMMSYTKNNILVQSAQAMLAQANQTPQGVLQLLQ